MLYLNNKEILVKQFPNGESYIDIENGVEESLDFLNMFNIAGLGNSHVNLITLRYTSDLDIMGLVYLTDYIKEKGEQVDLLLPYIPYSRMDRQEGNRLFTLKSFARLINSLDFRKVVVYEPHSEVSIALIDRVKVVNKTYELTTRLLGSLVGGSIISKIFEGAEKSGIYLVYPDAGASKRYRKQFNYNNVIECSKERDFETGWIKSLTLTTENDFKECKKAVIVDDLCSKGGTFMMTAKALKDKGIDEIYLVVTHCENTIFDGEILTSDLIKTVVTTNSILTKTHEKIILVDINE